MSGENGEHGTRHRGRAEKIDTQKFQVQFSPEVVRSLAELEATVRRSKHFDSDILLNLQDYADGKTLSLSSALSGIAQVTREAVKHVQATGDEKAKTALSGLFDNLMENKSAVLIHSPHRTR